MNLRLFALFVVSFLFTARGLAEPSSSYQAHLESLWELSSEETLVGTVDGIVCQSGRVFVLDGWLRQIVVLSADGFPEGSIGREGEGPGEFRNPVALLQLIDNRLGVVDRFSSKVAVLTEDGTPAGDLKLGSGNEQIWAAASARNAIVVRSVERYFASEKRHIVHRLRRCATETIGAVTYVEEVVPMAPRGEALFQETLPAGRWALGPQGRVYVSPAYEEYRIQVFQGDGAELSSITQDYEHVPLPEARFAELKSSREKIDEVIGVYVAPSRFYRDIQSMHPRVDGSLWVQTSEGMPDPEGNHFGGFDVYDELGTLDRRVDIFVPYDPKVDQYFLVADRLFVVERGLDARRAMHAAANAAGDEEHQSSEPLRIVCYDFPYAIGAMAK
jgi:hypothetical protein